MSSIFRRRRPSESRLWTRSVSVAFPAMVLILILPAWPDDGHGGWGRVEGQMLDPTPLDLSLVGDPHGVAALWSNPATLSAVSDDALLGLVSFAPNPGEVEVEFSQAVLGVRTGGLGVGFRRERFRPAPDEDHLMGSGFTISVSAGFRDVYLGISNDQYRRGVQESRWDVAGFWQPSEGVSVGVAWRDIASPMILSEERPQRLVLGGTAQLPDGWGSASYEGTIVDGAGQRHRGLLRLQVGGVDVLTGLDVDSGQGVTRMQIGLGYRFGANRGFGHLLRSRNRPEGDASSYHLGGERTLDGPGGGRIGLGG